MSEANVTRPSGRTPEQPREIRLTREFTRHAEGSVLVEFGETRVLCTASVVAGVPRWRLAVSRCSGSRGTWQSAIQGWVCR